MQSVIFAFEKTHRYNQEFSKLELVTSDLERFALYNAAFVKFVSLNSEFIAEISERSALLKLQPINLELFNRTFVEYKQQRNLAPANHITFSGRPT